METAQPDFHQGSSAHQLGTGNDGQATYMSMETSYELPNWRQDALAYDIEAGCDPWSYGRDGRPLAWLPWSLFGSKIDAKLRNPASCDDINYDWRQPGFMLGFIRRFTGFFIYCWILSMTHGKLERWGIQCHGPGVLNGRDQDQNALALTWAQAVITTAVCFLLAQAYTGVKAAREGMERVKQTTVTLAYSFLKTMLTEPGVGHDKDELQRMI